MTKNTLILLFFFQAFFGTNNFFAQNQFNDSIPSNHYITGESYIYNEAFQTGEELTYMAKYGFLKGAIATLKIQLEKNGYDYIYHVKATAKTAGATGKFFTVNDTYESYIEMQTGLPIKAIRNIREQNYWSYNEVLFDRKQNKVISLKSGEHKVPPNILDILSAFYYARRFLFMNIQPGEMVTITTYFEDKIYPLSIRFKKYDIIRTDFGKINCLKFVPVVEPGNVFRSEDDLEIWITNDKNYIPVKLKVDLLIGSLKCFLVDYSGLKNEFSSIKN